MLIRMSTPPQWTDVRARVLEVFQEKGKDGLSLADVVDATGLPPSTAHNVVEVFTAARWLTESWRQGKAHKVRRPVKWLRLTALGSAGEWSKAPAPMTMDRQRAAMMRELLRSKGPRTAGDLATALGISSASVSSRLRAIRSYEWLDLSWSSQGEDASVHFSAACQYQLNESGRKGAREALRLYQREVKRREAEAGRTRQRS